MNKNENLTLIIISFIWAIVLIFLYTYESKEAVLGASLGAIIMLIIFLVREII